MHKVLNMFGDDYTMFIVTLIVLFSIFLILFLYIFTYIWLLVRDQLHREAYRERMALISHTNRHIETYPVKIQIA